MSSLQLLLQGLAASLDPFILLMCAVGSFLGTIVGVLPGLGPGATLAILLPLAYGRPPLPTLVMLAGIYYGSQFGGAITSIALNVPGEASSVATCFDGYPLAKKGMAGKAIAIANFGSFFGGTVGVILLTFLASLLASFALRFGPPEYFAVYLFTFVAIVSLTKDSFFKGLVSLILGLLVSTIGLDAYTATARLDFGILDLMGGMEIIPVAVGLLGLSEIILSVANAEFINIKKDDPSLKFKIKDLYPTIKEFVFCLPTMIRTTLVGFFVGVLPGAGAAIAAMLGYKMEERVASDRKNFGKGSLQGVAAPETANNSCVSGAFVPMLSLGIPGSGSTALLLGALIMVGIQPGPGLFSRNPELVWGLIGSMYIGNIMLLLMCTLMIPLFIWLLRISQKPLPVIVAVLCVIGTFGAQNTFFDVGVMFFFTIVGLFFKSLDIPVAPLVIAVILGSDLEKSFRQTMAMFKGDMGLFSTRPIASVLLALCVVMIAFPIVGWIRELKKKKALPAG
jgi:putative tricarboxylic transport membrane protein